MAPRPDVTRRLGRPLALAGFGYAATVFVLASVVGFGRSPHVAFLFFIGSLGAALILLNAMIAWLYRPHTPMQSRGPIVAMLLAPIGLLFLIANIALLHGDGLWHGWTLVATMAILAGTIGVFVVGRITYRALDAADSEG